MGKGRGSNIVIKAREHFLLGSPEMENDFGYPQGMGITRIRLYGSKIGKGSIFQSAMHPDFLKTVHRFGFDGLV